MPKVYINIHTHKKPQSSEEFVIRNAFLVSPSKLNALDYSISVGIHPWLIQADWHLQIDKLKKLLNLPKVIALGECGIDRVKDIHISTQYEVMEAQIELNRYIAKPYIIHCVRAYSDIAYFLKKMDASVIFHDYRGNIEQTKKLNKDNVFFSFGKSLLQPSEKLKEVITYLSPEKILLETDMANVPIQEVYRAYSQLKKMPLDILTLQIPQNLKNTGIPLDIND